MRFSRVGSIENRFFTRFIMDKETGCWNWNGTVSNDGYGKIAGILNGKRYVPKGAQMLAHRVSWIIHRGDIPDGEGFHGTVIMHKCDNRLCVNPEHLMLGTQADNVADMISKGRKRSNTPKGVLHWNASIKDTAAIELIRSTKRNTKALAEKYKVSICTIKRIRRGVNYADNHTA